MFYAEQEPMKTNFDYQINLKDFKELKETELVSCQDLLHDTDLLDKWYNKYDVQKVLRKMFD